MSTRPIRFYHRGQIHELSQAAPTMTTLQWLREQAHGMGTKEGCAEGDCGACTVLVGELDPQGELQLRNINACIQFLPALDGRALLTVEDLGSSAQLNPVQQALVDCHGSQCGFCTPGFAMTLQAIYERHQADGSRPSRQRLADDLSGNLCRCTGYKPILDAGERMFKLKPATLDRAPIVAALKSLQTDTALHYQALNPVTGQAQQLHAPRTLPELAALREAKPDARLVAGATDVGLWVNKQHRELGDVILLGSVAELREIRPQPFEGRPGLWIGAAASLEDAWSALSDAVPALRELWLRFASPPVRHAGTLGGNIANGSPIGDGAPALIALGADIVLRRGATQRRLPLQDFYLDYMKNALQPGEFVEALHLPLPGADERIGAYKISKRRDSDISAVCAVMKLRMADGRVQEARLAFGGMAAIVKRAGQAEAALTGQAWSETTMQAAAAALPTDFSPLSDMRASAAYRMQVAQNLLRRFWLESRDEAPLPATQTSVWAAADFDRRAV